MTFSLTDYVDIIPTSATTQMPDWNLAPYAALKWDTSIDFTQHEVTADEAQNPDLIAYRQYGDEAYYGLIVAFNDIINPLTDLVPGQQIRIPFLEQILHVLDTASDALSLPGSIVI